MDRRNPARKPAFIGSAAPTAPGAIPGTASGAHATGSATRPASKPAQPAAPHHPLSHHELATLMLLLSSPADVCAKPEIPSLRAAGLVEQVASRQGRQHVRLTHAGNAVLRGLGLIDRHSGHIG